jgi:hypothetical protein
LKRPSRKLAYALMLTAVFLLSYAAAFFAISFAPYGRYRDRVYSDPQASVEQQLATGKLTISHSNLSTVEGGAWQEQLLNVFPLPGANNVSCDTSIIIDAARPERVWNISLSPNVAIAKDIYVLSSGFSPPSSVQTVYPAGLLQPNTTYNVTGIVAGGWNGQGNLPSWWIFTTSSGPSQLAFVYSLASYDTWITLAIAILVTTIVSVSLLLKNRGLPIFYERKNPLLSSDLAVWNLNLNYGAVAEI